ncbi:hypothetical protein Neosp_001454 [[Neocosmospora] mangrovei]
MSLMISVTCGSTASEDQASASTVLKAYCDQDWKVEFPKPKYPVSSYIDEISAMTELAPCGPQALASCLCLKNSVSKAVSSTLSWEIKNRCHTNMLDNLSSANAVLDYYCSAAKGEVTATGIAVSQTESASTRAGSGSMATETNTSDESESKSKGPKAGVIAGAVVGAVVGVLLGGGLVFFFMRKRARSKKQANGGSLPEHHSEERIQRDDVRLDRVAPSGDEIAPPPYEEGPSGGMSSKK